VHACVAVEDSDTREDLDDLVDYIESSMGPITDPMSAVELRLQVGDTDQSWSGYDHRRLYLLHWRAGAGYVPE
jgi:hypothetical protein